MKVSMDHLAQAWKEGWVVLFRMFHFFIFLDILYVFLMLPVHLVFEEYRRWCLILICLVYSICVLPLIFYQSAKWAKRWLQTSTEKPHLWPVEGIRFW